MVTTRLLSLALAILTISAPALAGPTVVPTAEGQVGDMPGPGDVGEGVRFESVRGQAGEILLGGLFVFGGSMPPPPEFSFLLDRLHGSPNPVPVDAEPATFNNVFKLAPASARARNAADDGDFVAFSFATDGTEPMTMTLRIVTFDETGSSLTNIALDNLPTFPDPTFNDTAVAVDDQGRVTVAYTNLELGPPLAARIAAQRFDALTGLPIGGEITVTAADRANAGIALLDPAGERLIVPATDFVSIRGNIVDTTGGTPVVLPEFPISTTPGLVNFNPVVAADLGTGAFLVAWENVEDLPGDPVNVRARRFDAMGNPIGDDFVVNATTAGAQGQQAVAFGPGGRSVVVWAGEAEDFLQDRLDVFAQVYDSAGNPIGGEIVVNSDRAAWQDRPAVRFLPEPDALGQPQFAVLWRDYEDESGGTPRGTGTSYRCFTIGEDPTAIFADGFESGDTSSWSDSQP